MSAPTGARGAGRPIEVDEDISNLGAGMIDNRPGAPSPTKKRDRSSEADTGREAGGLTLADLQLALAPVLQGLQNVQGRMQLVETQVSQKLDSTPSLVKTLDQRQKDQKSPRLLLA